jgi:TonB family protein
MKKTIRMVLAVIVTGAWMFAGTVVSAVDPKAKSLEIPGSATMPPKTVDAPQPPACKNGTAGARVVVWIKEDGTVSEVEFIKGTEEWREDLLATVKKWRFEPVVYEGKPIVARTEVSFTQSGPKNVWFNISPMPNFPGEVHVSDELGLVKPVIEKDPELILPLAVRAIGSSVEAVLSYVVEEEGVTGRIEILGGSSEGAARSALDLVSARKYQPGRVRDRAVAVQFKQHLAFHGLDMPIAALKGAVDIVDPAYPYERLLAQEEGYATVRFKLGTNGAVISTELVEASHPDFGGALLAAVESWMFSSASVVDQDVREYRHDFTLAGTPYAARRLIDLAREQKSVSKSAAGLDAKPKMLARPALAYPTALFSEKIPGSANVEFVIDRVGLAQVPRVVSATRPEFGWAAVTLVNGMRFVPLTRGGKPVELRVEIPITFTPPKSDEPAATP